MRRRASIRCLASLLSACAMGLSGCGGSEPHSEEAKEAAEAHMAVYETRGIVQGLPEEGKPASEFRVRHEAIPDFRPTWMSENLGMNAMVMPFPPAEGVSLEGVEVGEKVRLRFEVQYHIETGALMGYEVVEITELPPETELDFGPADPPSTRGDGNSAADPG